MIQLPPDFKELLSLLNSKQVEYLIIGGYAVAFHGYPRATGDIDIWVGKNSENASRLMDVLHDFGFRVPDDEKKRFLIEPRVLRMGIPPLRVEVLSSISGVEFEECFKSRETAILDNIEVYMISLHHLKINKKASGRLQDLSDLEKLP